MAISWLTGSTWQEYTNDGNVSIPGSPTDGMRMYLFVGWKDQSVTLATPSGWNLIGSSFADGAVASGNGTGSMRISAFYRDWQSGDTSVALDFSGAVIALADIEIFDKASTDSWNDPSTVTAAWPATSTTQTVSASSATVVPHNSVVLAHIALRDDSAAFTRGATTGIDVSSGITWNGNYVESPSVHGTTGTGNDMASDLGHRFVTTGGNVTLRVTATISATETGSVRWVIQGLGGRGFAQAQAQIKALNIEGIGQAQAKINAFNVEGFGQAQTKIRAGFTRASDTFTRSISNSWGTADVGGDWTLYGETAFDTAEFDVTGSNATISVGTDRLLNLGQLQDIVIRDVNVQFRWKLNDVDVPETVIIIFTRQIGNLPINGSYQIYGAVENGLQAPSVWRWSGKTLDNLNTGSSLAVVDDTWYWIKFQTFNESSNVRLRLKLWADGASEPSTWNIDYLDTSPGATGLSHGIVSIGIEDAAVGLIYSFDDVNVSTLLPGLTTYGQAQAEILASIVVRNSYAQAQAQIKSFNVSRYAQAQAFIAVLVASDNFQRTESVGWGISTPNPDIIWTDRDAIVPGIIEAGSVSGSYGVTPTGAVQTRKQGYPLLRRGMVQFDFWVPANSANNGDYNIDSLYGGVQAVGAAGSTWDIREVFAADFLYNFTPDPSSWYTVKFTTGIQGDTIWAKVWKTGSSEPNWLVSGTQTSSNSPRYFSIDSTTSEESRVDNIFFWTFDNIFTVSPQIKYAQAQAVIKRTYNSVAQAQAKIAGTITVYAQAQAWIYISVGLRPVQDIATDSIVGVVI